MSTTVPAETVSTTVPAEDAPVMLSNEFAEVTVRRVVHGLGTRLEIVSPRSGRITFIDPVVLEGLTALTSDHLSAIVVAGVPGNDDRLLLYNAGRDAHGPAAPR